MSGDEPTSKTLTQEEAAEMCKRGTHVHQAMKGWYVAAVVFPDEMFEKWWASTEYAINAVDCEAPDHEYAAFKRCAWAAWNASVGQ